MEKKKLVQLQSINVNNFFDQPVEFYDLLAKGACETKPNGPMQTGKPVKRQEVEDKDKTKELRDLIFGEGTKKKQVKEESDHEEELKELILSLEGGKREPETEKEAFEIKEWKEDEWNQKAKRKKKERKIKETPSPSLGNQMEMISQLKSALGLDQEIKEPSQNQPKKDEAKKPTVNLMNELFGDSASGPVERVYQISLLDQNGLLFGSLPGICEGKASISCPNASDFAMASNGLLMAVISRFAFSLCFQAFNPIEKLLEIWNLVKVTKKQEFPFSNIISMSFSPLNNFLVVIGKKEDGKTHQTSILSVSGRKQLAPLFSVDHQKFLKAQAPYVRFLHDESKMIYCKQGPSGAEVFVHQPILQERLKNKEKKSDVISFFCTESFPVSAYSSWSIASGPTQSPLIFMVGFQNEEKGHLEEGYLTVWGLNGSKIFSEALQDSNLATLKHSPNGILFLFAH